MFGKWGNNEMGKTIKLIKIILSYLFGTKKVETKYEKALHTLPAKAEFATKCNKNENKNKHNNSGQQDNVRISFVYNIPNTIR